ncbi:SGNH/GDSL hydrolase family protein [Shimia thalassica]|nr:SGNH/GDSL hydrolase family protein [Shimia thalassica]MDO6523274.1 SGNH/GDSL hydrolase family protein [Shimia thalassica]
MAAPIPFSLATSGTDPKVATKEDLETAINASLDAAYDGAMQATQDLDESLVSVAKSGDSDDLTEGAAKLLLTPAERTKVGHLTVTGATDLDDIRARVADLDAAVVLRGEWDASSGVFPNGGAAQAGAAWIITTAGAIDGVEFEIDDRVLAITDNASETVYADNWLKLDYTDKVLSVAGKTGAVDLDKGDVNLGSVDNTPDADKPVSTAQQAAFDAQKAEAHRQRGILADGTDLKNVHAPGCYLLAASASYLSVPDGFDQAVAAWLFVDAYGLAGGSGAGYFVRQTIRSTDIFGEGDAAYRPCFERRVNTTDVDDADGYEAWVEVKPAAYLNDLVSRKRGTVLVNTDLATVTEVGTYRLLADGNYGTAPASMDAAKAQTMRVYGAGGLDGEGAGEFVHQEIFSMDVQGAGDTAYVETFRRRVDLAKPDDLTGENFWYPVTPAEAVMPRLDALEGGAMLPRGTVAAGADLDTITTPGMHYLSADGAYLSMPEEWGDVSAAWLDVYSAGDTDGTGPARFLRQVITSADVTDPNSQRGYRRKYERLLDTQNASATAGYAAWEPIHPNAIPALADKTVIFLGDSITQGSNTYDWVSKVGATTGATVVNGGCGGSTWGYNDGDPEKDGLAAYRMAASVLADNWTAVTAAAIAQDTEDGYTLRQEHVAALSALDWSNVDTVVLSFGTNDFTGELPIGADTDSTVATFKGAINKTITDLVAAYPALQVVLVTSMWRSRVVVNGDDSHVTPNGAGVFLADYVAAIKERAAALSLPVIDLHASDGVNILNWETFIPDGLHPFSAEGEANLARLMSSGLLHTSGVGAIEGGSAPQAAFSPLDEGARIWITGTKILFPRLRVTVEGAPTNLTDKAAGGHDVFDLATVDDFPDSRFYWANTVAGEIQTGTTAPVETESVVLLGASRAGVFTNRSGLPVVDVMALRQQSLIQPEGLQHLLGGVLSDDEDNLTDVHYITTGGHYVEFVPDVSGGTGFVQGDGAQIALTHLPVGWKVYFVDVAGADAADRLTLFCGHGSSGFNGSVFQQFLTTTRQNAVIEVHNLAGRLCVRSMVGDDTDFVFSDGTVPVPDRTVLGAGQSQIVRQESTGAIGAFFRGIQDAAYVDAPVSGEYVGYIQGATGGTVLFKSETAGTNYWIDDTAGDDPAGWVDGVAMTTCRTALSTADAAGWPVPTICLYDHGYSSMLSLDLKNITVAKAQDGFEWIMSEIQGDTNTHAAMRVVASVTGSISRDIDVGSTGIRLAKMLALADNFTWIAQGPETYDKYRPNERDDPHLTASGFRAWMKQQARAYLNASDTQNNDNNLGPVGSAGLFNGDPTRVIVNLTSSVGIDPDAPQGNLGAHLFVQKYPLDIGAISPGDASDGWGMVEAVSMQRTSDTQFILQFDQDMTGARIVYPAGRVAGSLSGSFIRDVEGLPLRSFISGVLA